MRGGGVGDSHGAPLRLTLLTQFFAPETGAPANRLTALAEALSQRMTVRIVTLKPSYPRPEYYSDTDTKRTDRSTGCEVLRTTQLSPHAGSFAIRALREVVMSVVLGLVALTRKTDIVLVSTPSMFLVPAAACVAVIRRARLVVDVRDLTWKYAHESGRSGYLARWCADRLGLILLRILRSAELITSTNEGNAAALVAGGLAAQKLVIVPNGVGDEVWESLRRIGPRRGDDPPRVSYIGLVGYNQGVGVLLDVAALLPRTEFWIVGDGPERSELEERARTRRLQNVRFKGFLDRRNVLTVYARSQVLFAQLRDLPSLNDTAVPSKLYEYMAAGRPLVYAGRGIAADLVAQSGAGIVVSPNDPVAIANAIGLLCSDVQLSTKMSAAGRRFVNREGRRDQIMRDFACILIDRLLNGGGSVGNAPHGNASGGEVRSTTS